jgi:hypothetical protein
MYNYVNPHGRARIAQIALALYIVLQVAVTAGAIILPAGSDIVVIGAAVLIVEAIATVVVVSIWIHRVNANAHSFADGLSITPGWNIGWFFVPIASFWKPFQGIKETWQASRDPEQWPYVPVPDALRVWWGCWIAGNALTNISMRLDGMDSPLTVLDLMAMVAMIGSAGLLMHIIGSITKMQTVTALSRGSPQPSSP